MPKKIEKPKNLIIVLTENDREKMKASNRNLKVTISHLIEWGLLDSHIDLSEETEEKKQVIFEAFKGLNSKLNDYWGELEREDYRIFQNRYGNIVILPSDKSEYYPGAK